MAYVSGIRTVLMCGLLAIAISAFGQDGVTLIDQSHALAGNITPGDAPGFPVTISRSGSYRLASNLVLPSSNTIGILITAPNVSLDLSGFSILGGGACSQDPLGFAICPNPGQGVGVQAGDDQTPGPRSVTVRNGSVRGMSRSGIQITGDGSQVDRVTSDGNFREGFDVNGSVSSSSATGNGFDGIQAVSIHDSTSLRNRRFGILVRSVGGVASGNVISLNGFQGISAANSTIRGNASTANQGTGIFANCPSVVAENTVVDNHDNSIETVGSGCLLVNNATRP